MRFPKWPRWVWRCYAATAAAMLAFAVCSFWPMWIVTRDKLHSDCGLGYGNRHSLWGMLLSERPRQYSDGYSKSITIWEWEEPAIITAVTMHVAAIAGFILGGVRWRKGGPDASPEGVTGNSQG